jgi:hypothetical protein
MWLARRWFFRMLFSSTDVDLELSTLVTHNGLRANEGRETKALNCKPNTNLKEIFEPSN